MKTISRFFVIVLFFLVAVPAFAMTVRGGQAVNIKENEDISGTLLVGGNSVTIDGTVHGDVICGSQSVVITGTVDGDVICAAQTIRISGDVTGSVRAAAQTIEIAGPVGRNVTVAGQSLTIVQTGTVNGEILAAAGHVSINSAVAGDVSVAVNTLTLGDAANVKGSVHYQSKNTATVAPSATIAGTLTQSIPEKGTDTSAITRVNNVARGGSIIGKIIFFYILAVLIVLLAPKRTKRILDLMKTAPGHMMLAGFITIILVPVLIITMVFTLIGIPFAVLAAILFALALAAAEIFVSIYAGRYILNRFNSGREDNMAVNILVGVPVACILFAVPILGGIAGFLGAIWGLGAMIESRKATGRAK
jgi:cytoskeletal protein CcmA (bactofilin family)